MGAGGVRECLSGHGSLRGGHWRGPELHDVLVARASRKPPRPLGLGGFLDSLLVVRIDLLAKNYANLPKLVCTLRYQVGLDNLNIKVWVALCDEVANGSTAVAR